MYAFRRARVYVCVYGYLFISLIPHPHASPLRSHRFRHGSLAHLRPADGRQRRLLGPQQKRAAGDGRHERQADADGGDGAYRWGKQSIYMCSYKIGLFLGCKIITYCSTLERALSPTLSRVSSYGSGFGFPPAERHCGMLIPMATRHGCRSSFRTVGS